VVTTAQPLPPRPLVQWLLLACTLLGLAVMHTVGHTSLGMAPHDAHPGMVAEVAAPVPNLAALGADARDSCPGGHCDPHDAMSGWSVCLAILQGFAAAVLLTLALLALGRSRGAMRQAEDGAVPASRAPPPRPTGLTIASISVLRI
jgi:disulfide bond formation protein DsbB